MTTAIREKTDSFFCLGHLEDIPKSQQSPDERYCRDCFDFLAKEAEAYSGKPSWVPRSEPVQHRARKDKSITATIRRLEKKASRGKKGVSGITPNPHQTKPPGVTKRVTPPKTRKPTPPTNTVPVVTPQNVTEEVLEFLSQGKGIRETARLTGLYPVKVQRIRDGQRSLL